MTRPALLDYQIFFFDFDGVVKESHNIKGDLFVEIFPIASENTKRKIREHHNKNGGISRFEKIPIYMKMCGIRVTRREHERYLLRYSELVEQRVVSAPWVPCVRNVISEISHAGKEAYLLSATPHNELISIVEKIKLVGFFSGVFGGEIKKEIIMANLIRGRALESCVMIGDSQVDADSASKNGIDFILRRHGDNLHIAAGSSIRDFCGMINE